MRVFAAATSPSSGADVGKSTLLNQLVGEKVSTSKKATRHRITGIRTTSGAIHIRRHAGLPDNHRSRLSSG
jgi:putative ribosome biogenesis GTPase RsgA